MPSLRSLILSSAPLACVVCFLIAPASAAEFKQRKSVRTLKQTCDDLRGLTLSEEPIDPIEGAMATEVNSACLHTAPGDKPSDEQSTPAGPGSQSSPSFYGSPTSVQMKMLAAVRARAKLRKLQLDSLNAPEVSQPELAKLLARSLPSADGLQGGYLQDELIFRSLRSICGDFPELEKSFPQVCGKIDAAGDVDPLLALRVSLLIDSVNFPARLALRSGTDTSTKFQARLRLLTRLLEASMGATPLTSMVDLLAQDEEQLIAAGFSPKLARSMNRSGTLMLRLIGDLQAFPHANRAQAVALVVNAYGDLRSSAELETLKSHFDRELEQARAEFTAAQIKLNAAFTALESAKVKTPQLKLEAETHRKRVAELHAKFTAKTRVALEATRPTLNQAQIDASTQLAIFALEIGDLAFGKGRGDFNPSIILRKMDLLLGAISAAFTLVEGKPLWDPQLNAVIKVATAGLRSAIAGDLQGAHTAVQGAKKIAYNTTFGDDAPGIELLFRLAMAEDIGDLRAIALSQFVDVGPWAGDIIFGANVGALSMPDSGGNFEIAADMTLGYSWDSFGLVGKGHLSSLTFNSETTAGATQQRLVDTDRYGGRLEGWGVTAPSTFRFEGRLAWEGEVFDTISVGEGIEPNESEILAGELPLVFDETRLFNRILAMGAIRYEPSLTLGAYLGLGFGFQHENYDSVRTPGGNLIVLYDESIISGTFEARGRLQLAVVPNFFSLRFMSDSLWAGISQEAETLQVSGASGSPLIEPERTSGWRVESLNRIFFDIDALAFLGLTPSLSGGADMFAVNANQGLSVTFMPIFQFGLRATLF